MRQTSFSKDSVLCLLVPNRCIEKGSECIFLSGSFGRRQIDAPLYIVLERLDWRVQSQMTTLTSNVPHGIKKRYVGHSQVSDDSAYWRTALHRPRTTQHFVSEPDKVVLNLRG